MGNHLDTDYCNDKNRFYVYCFYNKDWDEIFYIGKGCGNRHKTLKGRSEHILQIFNNHSCVSKILIDILSEETAFKIEEKLKSEYIKRGAPIIDNEQNSINRLQRAGIERAKAEGKYTGGKKIPLPINFSEKYMLYRHREFTKTQFAQDLGISRPTLDRMIKEFIDKKE